MSEKSPVTGTPIIGGKADGQECPLKAVEITFDGDRYILMTFKESKEDGWRTHFFYMLCGMVPAEAVKIFRERNKP